MDYKRAFHVIDMDPVSYMKRFAIPAVLFGFLFAGIFYLFLPDLFSGPANVIPALIPVICILFAVLYPISAAEGKGSEIDNQMHYYISQMGAVATAQTPRVDIVRIVSENEEYGYLAEETKKIFELVTIWNKSLEDGCRFIAKRTPSVIFQDFLDRLAHGLKSGEDIKDFLSSEQNVVMNEYESMYNGAMYNIEVIKEMFISLIMSLIFLASFAVIMPVITGMDAVTLLLIVLATFVVTDLMILMYTKSKVPTDPVWQAPGRYVTDYRLKLYRSIPISLGGCLIVTILVILHGDLETPIAVALCLTPLVYTGRVASNIEKSIRRRDNNFPAFIRSLGSSAGARGGLIDEALRALRIHDFGPLTNDVNGLYRRINTRVDKVKSWEMFADNTGSHLIKRFSVTFVEATHLGGKPEVVGNMIATNFHRILALRKKRVQSANSLVGSLYGLTAGIGFTLYISLSVVELMQDMFMTIDMPPGMSMGMVIYTDIGDMGTLSLLVLLIMIVHSLLSAILLKVVDGGHMLIAVTNFVIMVWIAAISAVVTQEAVSSLLGIG